MTYLIAVSGMRGCLPDCNETFDHEEDAVSYMEHLFDLDRAQCMRLSQDEYLDLDVHVYGAEYIELVHRYEV